MVKDTLSCPTEYKQQAKNNNFTAWKYIKSERKVLRVIVKDDGRTIVTAYFDRDYLKKYKRRQQNENAKEVRYYEQSRSYAR